MGAIVGCGQDEATFKAMPRLLLLMLLLCTLTVAATPSIPGPVRPAAVPSQSYHQAPIVPVVCRPPWLGLCHECFQVVLYCRDVQGLHCRNIHLQVGALHVDTSSTTAS